MAEPIKGDASSRRYWRLHHEDGRSAILMLMPPPPPGHTNETALATTVVPFVAISFYLHNLGLSTPQIYAWDNQAGCVLLEDLGCLHYHDLDSTNTLYHEALNVLLTLHNQPHHPLIPTHDHTTWHALPTYNTDILLKEISLWGLWALPAENWERIAAPFLQAWREVLDYALSQAPSTLVLRDFHSPNFLWCPQRTQKQRLGILDFQDACIGHAAYDLVSLLQDARVDIAPEVEEKFLTIYLDHAGGDPHAFLQAYRCLGAQRATKIIGIFHRLKKRDGKAIYMQNVPRVYTYLMRNLDQLNLCNVRDVMYEYL